MTYESYKAELTAQFSQRLKAQGLWYPQIGMYAVLFAQTMVEAPAAMVPCAPSHRGHSKAPHECMGRLIVNKLAVFVPEQRHYALTQAGQEWLAKLKARGSIKTARLFAEAIEDHKKKGAKS